MHTNCDDYGLYPHQQHQTDIFARHIENREQKKGLVNEKADSDEKYAKF